MISDFAPIVCVVGFHHARCFDFPVLAQWPTNQFNTEARRLNLGSELTTTQTLPPTMTGLSSLSWLCPMALMRMSNLLQPIR